MHRFFRRDYLKYDRNSIYCQPREYVEYLYKKFQKKCRSSLSDGQLEMLQVRESRRQTNSTNTDYIPDIIDTGTDYGLSL